MPLNENHCIDCANPDCGLTGQDITMPCKLFLTALQKVCVHVFILPSRGEIVLGTCSLCGLRKYHANVIRDRALARTEFLNQKRGLVTIRWRGHTKNESKILENSQPLREVGPDIFMMDEKKLHKYL